MPADPHHPEREPERRPSAPLPGDSVPALPSGPVAPNPALLTALTTEHFTLQGARAATISESSSRSALYISAVASSLVALGFVAQVSKAGDVFLAFAFTVLPTSFCLGFFTWERVMENAVEDLQYLRAINRIRSYYLRIDPPSASYFMMSAHEDAAGMMANQGHAAARFEILFTSASVIALINSVLAGAVIALLVGSAFGAAVGVAAGVGAFCAIASLIIHLRREARVFQAVLFPEPGRDVKRSRRRLHLR